ncbi:MAG: hypothetical protein E7D55_14650, partial [Acinetobacter junii]|nr:hypothetical protein [Acinetobacter junii]
TPVISHVSELGSRPFPQIDAKLFWLMKRTAPNLYAKFLGTSYRLMK